MSELKILPLTTFALVLAVTLGITYWAAKRTHSASEFWAAGRGISSAQNGFAVAGDYMSASSFLGFAGLIFLFGVDGFVGLVAALVAFLPVLLWMAERMRNAGKYTMADVLTFRLRERPARMVAALGTLSVAFVYLIAQMVGAGALIQALTGVSFSIAVVLTGALMLTYVIFGGMIATTWVQIIKAGLLMIAGVVITLMVLIRFGFNIGEMFSVAAEQHAEGEAFLSPGLQFDAPLGLISFGVAFLLGTAGLPHILMRFFTVPDAKAARGSVAWAVFLIGAFYLMVMIIGVGARAILGQEGEEAAGKGGNLTVPTLTEELGGGAGTAGGDIFLAVVAGLVIAASGAVAHDLYSNVVRKGEDSEAAEVYVARIASVVIGVLSIVVALGAGSEFNVSAIVGLAFCVAASANFPALLLALSWERFNTTGAIAGILSGLISSVVLILLSAPVWPGPDSVTGSPLGPFGLDNPAIFCVPIGFLGCYLGTVLSTERDNEHDYHELYVRSETGLGAEVASEH